MEAENQKIKKARDAFKANLNEKQIAVLALVRKANRVSGVRELNEDEKALFHALPEKPIANSIRQAHAHFFLKEDRDMTRMNASYKQLDAASKKKLEEKMNADIQRYRNELKQFLKK